MIKYFLDQEAYEYLCEWAEQRLQAVQYCPAYDKKSVVRLFGNDDFTAYFDSTRYGFKYSIKLADRGMICKGKILHLPDSESDFDLQFEFSDKVKLDEYDALAHIMQVYCTAFVHANCFMWYGNVTEEREYKADGKNDSDTKIITFRKYKDDIYAVPVGHHRSPEGVFSVRGHFRCYKSGKVIWIDSYLKGL